MAALAIAMSLIFISCKDKSVDATSSPDTPSAPNPQHNAILQPVSTALKWSCSNSGGDALTFDVYFGTTNPPTATIATNVTQTSVSKTGLGNLTTYYWQVVAKSSKGTTTSGPVWQFTTTVNGMVLVASGTFQMGTTLIDDYEKPVHQVTLTNNYLIGKYEVTQKEWRDVVVWKQGSATTPLSPNPAYTKGDSMPVANVSWNDVQTWLGYLNEKEGVTDASKKYRLSTEAEWEFAARGGINSKGYKFSGSDSYLDVAWSSDVANAVIHQVGTKAPNELGLYDMSGNVDEWCMDYYGPYTSSAQTNPTGPSSGVYRILRGGCFVLAGTGVSSFFRDWDDPSTRFIYDNTGRAMYDWNGFRYVRPL